MPDALAIAVLLAGGLAGGFVNGMTGFGTAITALPIWLLMFEPHLAAALAATAGIIAQARSFAATAHLVVPAKVLPFIVPGLAGVPVGLWLATIVEPAVFRSTVGAAMIVYAVAMLGTGGWLRVRTAPRPVDWLIGFGGGIGGGLAGLSGVLPAIWSTLRRWPKDEKRALNQAFNFTILLLTVLASGAQGAWTLAFLTKLALVVPATLAGTMAGLAVYRRIGTGGFDRVVLLLLLVAGLCLVAR